MNQLLAPRNESEIILRKTFVNLNLQTESSRNKSLNIVESRDNRERYNSKLKLNQEYSDKGEKSLKEVSQVQVDILDR